MAFNLHFEKWLNDTLLELKRITDRKKAEETEVTLNNNKTFEDSTALNMSEKMDKQYVGAVDKNSNGESSRKPGNSRVKKTGAGNDYYKFVWNEDDGPMDIADDDDDEEDEVYRKRSTKRRVAEILGKTESERDLSEASDSFYDLPDNITGQLDNNYNFEPDFSLRYSASLDFSDVDDRASVASEPKSYADDPEQFMRDFHMENDFIEIERVDPEGQNIGDKRLSSNEDISIPSPNGAPSKGIFSSILSPKGKNTAGDGFKIRYVKTTDVVEDAYMDDDLKPVGLTAEECREAQNMYGTGMLPMTAVDMTLESEDEVMLDYGTAMAVGRSRSQKMSGDREPIVNIEEPTVRSWAAKHRRTVIGIGVAATIVMIVAFSVVVYFIVRVTRGV